LVLQKDCAPVTGSETPFDNAAGDIACLGFWAHAATRPRATRRIIPAERHRKLHRSKPNADTLHSSSSSSPGSSSSSHRSLRHPAQFEWFDADDFVFQPHSSRQTTSPSSSSSIQHPDIFAFRQACIAVSFLRIPAQQRRHSSYDSLVFREHPSPVKWPNREFVNSNCGEYTIVFFCPDSRQRAKSTLIHIV